MSAIVRGGRVPWAWLVVAAAVIWGLVALRPLLVPVAYLNDSSVHEQMVRAATARWRAGQLPLTTWFPYLNQGSPQFLHYQSLPAMLTGAVGLLTGPDVAFRWSLYLLLASWPISVYLAARLFGAGRGAAAASAAMSPFLWSFPGVGYEQQAYVWSGYGVWTQLWAMWTLPLAWGSSWRALREGRGYLCAVIFTALTVACHFETGYLALSVIIVWALFAGRPSLVRLRRAAILFGGALLACAWVIVPLLSQSHWASVNEALQGTGLVEGYGARQVLSWLVDGQVLDHGRFGVVSIIAAVGFLLALWRWRSDAGSRALLLALVLCLLLSFGPATWGSLIDIVPGHTDLFFRRFMMGVQLSCLLLAGRGADWLAGTAVTVTRRFGPKLAPRSAPRLAARRWLVPAVVIAVGVGVLAPAWIELDEYDSHLSTGVSAQHTTEGVEGVQLDQLLSIIRHDGGGRTYAGLPGNWGPDFQVGSVPVFKYLERKDIDEVGYTLRTASLMSQPENEFDQNLLSDDRLFGIRFLVLPAGMQLPVKAQLIKTVGQYTLWGVPDSGYVSVGRLVGSLNADRSDLGAVNSALVQSQLAADGEYLAVRYGSHAANGLLPSASGVVAAGTSSGSATGSAAGRAASSGIGRVVSSRVDLASGRARITVNMNHTGVVVLSASYDPGWRATVDGHPAATAMIAPAIVGVRVPAGTSTVTFTYHGYRWYPELFALALVTLLGLGGVPWWWRRRAQRALATP